MEIEFTDSEIKDVARAARIYCPGFDEVRFKSLIELEKRLIDSGYLDAVQGLVKLEAQKGMNCTQALDAYEHLIEENTDLEVRIASLKEKAEALTVEVTQAFNKRDQVKNEITKARRDLARIKRECRTAENKQDGVTKKMEKEKQQLLKEVEECRFQANIDKEEILAASRLKAEVTKQGFTIDLVLDLSRELAAYQNAREKLVQGLEEHGSLHKYLSEFNDQVGQEIERLSTDVNNLEAQKKRLNEEITALRNMNWKLETDIREQKELKRFHRRYAGIHVLMDKIVTWNQVFFVRCNNPVSAVAGIIDKNQANARFWTDKQPSFCPHCGYQQLLYDTNIYRQLNWPVGMPLKLTLGEQHGTE